ncbi:MAG: hypothetical protein QOH41_2866 [Blastocatellia bacterium]|jgi:hypothetical protein|nr:hypothetical protein [Blastocatellia bacterium]
MTKEEIVREARQLPLNERKAAADEITNSIQAEIEANGSVMTHEGNLEEKLAAFHRLYGMLKTDDPPPTDEELREDYINYLTEKYS